MKTHVATVAMILVSSAAAFAGETIDVNCNALALGNSAAITGQLTLEDGNDGKVLAKGTLNVTTKRQGTNHQPVNIPELAVSGEVRTLEGLPGADGKPTTLKTVEIANPGSGIQYIRISLNLYGQSWVRGEDAATYRTNCQVK